jgi:sarcosine oxidase subunit alpha
MRRVSTGGRIDRSAALRFTFDGTDYLGHPGDTLASALLANGVRRVATSVALGRPRGVMSAGIEDSCALVQIEQPFPEPMLTATAVELFDGLVARGLPGRGSLAHEPDTARYDAQHVHCDLLVVGAGPSGLVTALAAARAGVRVVLVDDQPVAGGSLLGSSDRLDDEPSERWVAAVIAELVDCADVRLLQRTTAFGYYDDGFVLALQKRTDHLGAAVAATGSRQRVWRIRAQQVVLATGAHERPVVFADNDRPGIMLADSASTYLNRYAVLVGQEIVVFTTNDSAYRSVVELADAGASVVAVLDSRHEIPQHWQQECASRGIQVLTGHVVAGTTGDDRISEVLAAPLIDGELGPLSSISCDSLLVSGGWNPAVHLYSQARGRLGYDPVLGAFIPDGQLPNVRVTGSAAGIFSLGECLTDGKRAARAALTAIGGFTAEVTLPLTVPTPPETPPEVIWLVPDPSEVAGGGPQFVDLQRDATVADVLRATGAGMRSVEHVKRYTTIGTAHDQGKTSGVIASGVIAGALGLDIADLGTTTFRPPYVPVSFAALAGRDRGVLHDPVRVTAIHPWHAAHGALFENVGQWKRPWYYPLPGEDLETAVLRECEAARTGVAMMDGSTLGKISVHGSDAAEFLDRIYTNVMSSLKVGSIRYGVMCGVDGMVIDDGTVIRIADREFLLTTTTGNAAMVLEWMEEWLQTEWPELRVSLTSVTEHWVTIPLVGPRSREVLAAAAPKLDVSNEAFPFMTWRDATVAGMAARICRISFSGELAYEINVLGWDGLAMWQALLEAGREHNITTYGTETMHVLRAEKGYPIIGQDTDGTVTPQDLGMSWVVSKKKADFIGKRSHQRDENQRPDRKHLVGLLSVEKDRLISEGAQIVASADLAARPAPMLGHVTSSYRSAALSRTFALALVRSGRERIGQTLHAYSSTHGEELIAVTVTEPVLYDPEGLRRDG